MILFRINNFHSQVAILGTVAEPFQNLSNHFKNARADHSAFAPPPGFRLSGLRLRKEAVAAMIRADGPNSLAAHAQAEARSVESYDHEKATALFARLAANGTWQVPTLALLRGFAFYDDPAFMRDNRLRFITPELREQWDKRRLAPSNDPFRGDAATRRRLFEKQLEVVGAMNRASVPIMAGTDTPGNFLIPGFALHDELALLVKAGLTPLEALRAATLTPAKFLSVA